MFCKQCGKEINQNSKFCANCGTSIDSVNSCPSLNTGSQRVEQEAKTYGSSFWKYFLLSFLVIMMSGVAEINAILSAAYLIFLILFLVSFCKFINQAMLSVGKKNWWPLGLLILLPLGFCITYFVVRHHLKPAGKWGKDSVLMIILVILVIIAIIGILAGMVLVSMSGARQKARDAKRMADMHQLVVAQEIFYSNNNAYLTCSKNGGDCHGRANNYPQAIGADLTPTPTDPTEDGSVCGTNYTYCGFDNTVNFGASFCYFAKLEGGGYYIASSDGNYEKATAPSNISDCVSENQNSQNTAYHTNNIDSTEENINEMVVEAKKSMTFPNKIDDMTTLVDITAESNAIRYHIVLSGFSDANIGNLSDDSLKEYMISGICQDQDMKDLLNQGINLEYSYKVEDMAQTYFITFNKSDCL